LTRGNRVRRRGTAAAIMRLSGLISVEGCSRLVKIWLLDHVDKKDIMNLSKRAVELVI
jgi:hypothetical protein